MSAATSTTIAAIRNGQARRRLGLRAFLVSLLAVMFALSLMFGQSYVPAGDVVRVLMTVRVQSSEQVEQAEAEAAQPHVQNVQYHHSDYDEALAQSESDDGAQPVRNALPKVGRNDPCPCGSGKKYKQCHGKLV